MSPEICLEHIKENRYHIVDCATGQPTDLGDGRRKKRAPSAYNLHMKECLHRKTGPIKERFKSCAAEYKKK